MWWSTHWLLWAPPIPWFLADHRMSNPANFSNVPYEACPVSIPEPRRRWVPASFLLLTEEERCLLPWHLANLVKGQCSQSETTPFNPSDMAFLGSFSSTDSLVLPPGFELFTEAFLSVDRCYLVCLWRKIAPRTTHYAVFVDVTLRILLLFC